MAFSNLSMGQYFKSYPLDLSKAALGY
jgi:hypothetical protein